MTQLNGIFVRLRLNEKPEGACNVAGLEFNEEGVSEPVIPRVAKRMINNFSMSLDESSLPEDVATLDEAVVAAIHYDTQALTQEHNERLEQRRKQEEERESKSKEEPAQHESAADEAPTEALFAESTDAFNHVPGTVYSEEQLGAIADREGIAGLRKIAEALDLKGRSIRELVDAILKAQAQE